MLTLLAVLAFLWGLISYWCYRNLTRLFRKYGDPLRIPTSEKCNGFLRMDYGKWDRKALFRRCFTHFPLRITLMVIFMIVYGLLAVLHRYVKLPAIFVKFHSMYYGSFAVKTCFNVVEEFDTSEDVRAPVIVSNHVSWLDIIYYGTRLKTRASFVAKKQINDLPVVGAIAAYLRTVVVDRKDKNSKQTTTQGIRQRVREFEKDPKNTPPIVIFAEGTVSNGRSVMTFKNGAFENMSPIALYSLRYESKQFHTSDVEISMGENAFLMLCSDTTLRVRREHVSAKQGEGVEAYRERCRQRIAEMGNFKLYDVTFSDYLQYQKEYNRQLTLPENQHKSNAPRKTSGS